MEQADRVNGLTHSVIGYLTLGHRVTVESAVGIYIEAMRTYRSEKHIHNAKNCLGQWLKRVKKISGLNPAAVEPDHIDEFVNDSGLTTASTRRLRLSYIRKFFDYCQSAGMTTKNPARLVMVNLRALNHAQKEPKVVEYYTEAEVSSIIAAINKDMLTTVRIDELADLMFWSCAIRLAFATGLRFGDVINLEWDSFGDMIAIHTQKTGVRVTPEEIAKIKAILKDAPRKASPYIFPGQREMYADVRKRSNFSMWFRRMCHRLQVPYKGLHALRHGYATALHQAGRDITTVARALGHTQTATTEGYIHD